jgi:hypothetical protein
MNLLILLAARPFTREKQNPATGSGSVFITHRKSQRQAPIYGPDFGRMNFLTDYAALLFAAITE